MEGVLTSDLTVSAATHGTVVWYTIHPSDSDRTEIKTIRFSELDEMHGRLSKEVPTFPGRLPPKTLKRNANPNFVETRRKAVEVYLRLASTNEMARVSTAWHSFFAGCSTAAIDSSAAAKSSGEAKSTGKDETKDKADDGEGSEDEAEALGNTVTDEVKILLQSKRTNLTAAQEKKGSLEENLSTIEDSVVNAEAEAKGLAALESEAAARLRAHRDSLAELDMNLSVKNMISNGNERQKSEMAKRLLEELQLKLQMSTESRSKAQKSFDAASKATADACARGHSNFTAATEAKVAAEATHADAQESHSAMNVAMSVLQVRAKARLDDVNIAERELDNLKLAKQVIDAEKNEAGNLLQKVEVETKAALAAVAAHIEESECRNRAHELATKRANVSSGNSATLRDMRTRGLLMGEDRTALEAAENAANAAAELAADALAKCEQAGNETTQKDEYQLESLRAIATVANKKLRKRETITASLTARSMANQTGIDDASAKLAAAVAPNNAIQQRFETLKQQVETLAQALPECTGKLDEATRALSECKRTGETEQLPLRHAEQVESQVLKGRQAEEAALIKALAEAQISAAEATAAYESSMEAGPDFAELVTKSEALWTGLDKIAQEEARSYKDAMEAIEAVKSDLAAIDSDDDGSDEQDSEEENDNDDEDEEDADEKKKKHSDKDVEREAARAALSAKIEPLEVNAGDKKNDAKNAATAAKTARGELDALRAQMKSTFCPAEMLVKQEIAFVDAGLADHKDKEGAIMAEVKQKVAAWMAEKETLGADLHRAQLLAAAAEADVVSNKVLAKSLAEAKKG